MTTKDHIDDGLQPYRVGVDGLLVGVLLLPLTLLLVLESILSLSWRMVHDAPLLHYVAFLVDRYGYALYRDVFETSMPGTFAFHLLIGRFLGYGDLAFRLTDIAWLGGLLCVTWGIMRPFGRRVAWASVVLFGLSYLQYGPSESLERDYVGLLPIGIAVLLAVRGAQRRFAVRAFAVGLLFGLSATIKPHLAIGLPLVLLYQGGGDISKSFQ